MKHTNNISKQPEVFNSETGGPASVHLFQKTTDSKINLEEFISEVTDLISLPEVYLKISELMDDTRSVLDDFAKVVSSDPNLTANVLKIVNSAYFGFAGQIENISRSLNMMGLGQLHDLVLGISVVESFDVSSEVIDLPSFWRRSIVSGVLAKLLAKQVNLPEAESLFVIGLLHEIGHLILFLKRPEQLQLIQDLAQQQDRPIYQLEQEILGVHYGQVGQQLMAAWNLPVKLQLVTGYQPEPAKAQTFTLETALVHIAHGYASIAGSDTVADQIPNLIDPGVWQTTGLTAESIEMQLDQADSISAVMEKLILR